jgi:alkylated DNA repair dioxygenase AlkB
MEPQIGLFSESTANSQELAGFSYEREFISEAEAATLVAAISELTLKPFEFRGYLGNRRVIWFGYRYDFTQRRIETAEGIPLFLEDLRRKVARFAGRRDDEFVQVGISEYSVGAGIGWHRDKSQFGIVAGVSLLAPAKMRFRRREGTGWRRQTRIIEPRSVYLLSGEIRDDWEHSIPPMDSLRYSLTFRTLATKKK